MLLKRILMALSMLIISDLLYAETCPDPLTTSLREGVIPPPWRANPASPSPVQGGTATHFSHANILVLNYGIGVTCNYKFPKGTYSIWWPVSVKIPAPTDYLWIEILMGYICSDSISSCQFRVAM